jgi:hypothetical protein
MMQQRKKDMPVVKKKYQSDPVKLFYSKNHEESEYSMIEQHQHQT